jgi:outer membrane protein OmpA-like peptidoglycan-associated protein
MKMRRILLGTAMAVMLPTAAMAATEGFYVGVQGGANFTRDTSVTDDALAAGSRTFFTGAEAKYKTGWAAGAVAGYATAIGIRAELEFAYRSNELESLTAVGGTASRSGVSGSLHSYSVLANVLYDFDTGTAFTPYIGAGAGVSLLKNKLSYGAVTGSPSFTSSDDDTVFAYQGIVGVAYNVTSNLAITADYRYFGTVGGKFDGTYGAPVSGTYTQQQDYGNHTVMVGLRYNFGGPVSVAAPAVTPPAAVQPQTEYLVFFDWDKAEITPVSDKIIGDAAAAAGRVRAVSVHVIGHTDTSGSPAYNQRLSVRRAEAVKRGLVTKGVPANQVSIEGKGETQLLVPTGANVREPSNRRAQILIRVK